MLPVFLKKLRRIILNDAHLNIKNKTDHNAVNNFSLKYIIVFVPKLQIY